METAPSQTRPFSQTEINWDKLDKTKFYVIGAGIFSAVTVALYPISVVKTRLQIVSKDSVERNAFSVTRGLLKAEGIPGLYKGFGTVITGAVPARIIFLTALETTKVAAFRMVEPLKLSEPTQAAIANGIAGMTASLFAQAVVVPIDVVSQRLMVQGYSGHASYSGGLDVARKVLKSDGIRGLYRGFSLSVMTYSPSSAVWWASYGSSQRVIWRFLGHGTESDEAPPSQLSIMLVQGAGGIFAGAAASCITTPLDTIKTRLQGQNCHFLYTGVAAPMPSVRLALRRHLIVPADISSALQRHCFLLGLALQRELRFFPNLLGAAAPPTMLLLAPQRELRCPGREGLGLT